MELKNIVSHCYVLENEVKSISTLGQAWVLLVVDGESLGAGQSGLRDKLVVGRIHLGDGRW